MLKHWKRTLWYPVMLFVLFTVTVIPVLLMNPLVDNVWQAVRVAAILDVLLAIILLVGLEGGVKSRVVVWRRWLKEVTEGLIEEMGRYRG